MPPGLSKGLRRGLFDISTPQPQVTPFSNERTLPISGASRGTKYAPSTTSVPQHRTNPPSNESIVPNAINTSSNGASRGTKRCASAVLAPQPQCNLTYHEPTILTSIGTSINGVHRWSNRRVFAISIPQSQMNMSSKPTSPILDGTSTDGAPKSFKKVCGKTCCLASERALHAAGRKLSVTIKAEDGRPSGTNSKFFYHRNWFYHSNLCTPTVRVLWKYSRSTERIIGFLTIDQV